MQAPVRVASVLGNSNQENLQNVANPSSSNNANGRARGTPRERVVTQNKVSSVPQLEAKVKQLQSKLSRVEKNEQKLVQELDQVKRDRKVEKHTLSLVERAMERQQSALFAAQKRLKELESQRAWDLTQTVKDTAVPSVPRPRMFRPGQDSWDDLCSLLCAGETELARLQHENAQYVDIHEQLKGRIADLEQEIARLKPPHKYVGKEDDMVSDVQVENGCLCSSSEEDSTPRSVDGTPRRKGTLVSEESTVYSPPQIDSSPTSKASILSEHDLDFDLPSISAYVESLAEKFEEKDINFPLESAGEGRWRMCGSDDLLNLAIHDGLLVVEQQVANRRKYVDILKVMLE